VRANAFLFQDSHLRKASRMMKARANDRQKNSAVMPADCAAVGAMPKSAGSKKNVAAHEMRRPIAAFARASIADMFCASETGAQRGV